MRSAGHEDRTGGPQDRRRSAGQDRTAGGQEDRRSAGPDRTGQDRTGPDRTAGQEVRTGQDRRRSGHGIRTGQEDRTGPQNKKNHKKNRSDFAPVFAVDSARISRGFCCRNRTKSDEIRPPPVEGVLCACPPTPSGGEVASDAEKASSPPIGGGQKSPPRMGDRPPERGVRGFRAGFCTNF
jgi:hypothetical protein